MNLPKEYKMETYSDARDVKTTDFFISEKHFFAWCLLECGRLQFNEELGVTTRHYFDKELAVEWRDKMLVLLHPDNNVEDIFKTNELLLIKNINQIFKRMVGEA